MKYVYVLYTRNCNNGELEWLNCFSSMKKVKGFMDSRIGELTKQGERYCVYCWKHDLNGNLIGTMFTDFLGKGVC